MSQTPTFYILHGDDSLAREGALMKLRAAMQDDAELNTTILQSDAPVAEVLGAAKSMPFLADKRLVIAHGLISRITRRDAGDAGKAAVKRLLEELPKLPPFARLVFYETETLEDSNRLLKKARDMPNGFALNFSAPDSLQQWLMARAKANGAEISPQAAQAISDLLSYGEHSRNANNKKNAARRREGRRGRALALLAAENELAKLADYVDGARPISEEDVAALTPYVPEANIFELVDALVDGRGDRAFQLMAQYFHDNPNDSKGMRLFAMFVGQFRRLLMARDYLDSGGSGGKDMALALGLHSFVAGKLAKQARRFSREQLILILKRLQRYDEEMKTGQIIDPRLALDILLVSLARQ